MRIRSYINEIVINNRYSLSANNYDWITDKRRNWVFYRYINHYLYKSKYYTHVNLQIVNYYFKRRDNFECERFYHICG